jgi:hypothetical protein
MALIDQTVLGGGGIDGHAADRIEHFGRRNLVVMVTMRTACAMRVTGMGIVPRMRVSCLCHRDLAS